MSTATPPPETLTRSFPWPDSAGGRERIQAARDSALPEWTAITRDKRRQLLLRLAQLLKEHADELATMTVVENAMPIFDGGQQPRSRRGSIRVQRGLGRQDRRHRRTDVAGPALDYTLEEPYGVVGVIIPWNGPLASIGMVVAPALAAGNCVVLKPPELTPWTSLRFGELVLEAGIPPGVVNVIPGGAAAGEALPAIPASISCTSPAALPPRVLCSPERSATSHRCAWS